MLRRVNSKWIKVMQIKPLTMFLIVSIAFLASLPSLLPDYPLIFASYWLIYSIVGLSVNLLLRNAGLASMGHSAFFTVGAYTVGLLTLYAGIYNIDLLIVAAILASMVVALVLGSVSCRHTRLYFTVLTLSLAEVVHTIIHWVYGATGLPVPLIISTDEETFLLGMAFSGISRIEFLRRIYYYYILGWFILSVLFLYLVQRSPLGLALNASRQNEERLVDVGTVVYRLRIIAFTISGGLTGLAGALWTPLSGLVDPHMIHWEVSIQYLAYALIGGGIYLGPVAGTFAINLLMEIFASLTIYWKFLLGLTLAVIILASRTERLATAIYIYKRTLTSKPTPLSNVKRMSALMERQHEAG